MTNGDNTDLRSGERLRVLHTTSARRLPDASLPRPRRRRALLPRPRPSWLNTDIRYLLMRLVACVNEGTRTRIADGFSIFSGLNGKPRPTFDFHNFLSPDIAENTVMW